MSFIKLTYLGRRRQEQQKTLHLWLDDMKPAKEYNPIESLADCQLRRPRFERSCRVLMFQPTQDSAKAFYDDHIHQIAQ